MHCAAPRPARDCLLYTSDAADERSSVDLGGRRIIKKKKNDDLGARSRRADKRTDSDTTSRIGHPLVRER